MEPFFDKNRNTTNWRSLQILNTLSFICGFCGDKISSNIGYKIGLNQDGSGNPIGGIYICSNCNGPIFISPQGDQYPGPIFGDNLKHVPEQLNSLYNEARKSISNKCYTGAVLLCRKMLMNLSVNQGAKEGLNFFEYVNFLSENGYIPPNGKHWVDHIRKKGNEATHEIILMEQKDAEELLIFIEMLLKFIYEFPNMIPKTNT